MQDTQNTTDDRRQDTRTLLAAMVRELFQTEQSAKTHPVTEADRLGDVPPAYALRAVAHHAETALSELPTITKHEDLPVSDGGRGVGALFAALRERFADLTLNEEQSYRATLVGMRHGLDLVESIRHVARVEGDDALVAWCGAWLDRRRVLVDSVASELAWFSRHPDCALRPAMSGAVARGVNALVHGVENLTARVRQLRPH